MTVSQSWMVYNIRENPINMDDAKGYPYFRKAAYGSESKLWSSCPPNTLEMDVIEWIAMDSHCPQKGDPCASNLGRTMMHPSTHQGTGPADYSEPRGSLGVASFSEKIGARWSP